jgi:hypothetical protein
MFVINEDKSIYITRGDVAFFSLLVKTETGETYKFQAGDVIRFKVYEKKACENVVLSKDFGIEAETEEIEIYLSEKDTKIGDVISKPTDYWYEVELNPYTNPQTILGYDDDGAKVFKLFPEGNEKEDDEPITPEDIPVVDAELDLTSTRPVQNQAIARAVAGVKTEVQNELTKHSKEIDAALSQHSKEIDASIGDRIDEEISSRIEESIEDEIAEKVDAKLDAEVSTKVDEEISESFGHYLLTDISDDFLEDDEHPGTTIAKVYKQGNVISGALLYMCTDTEAEYKGETLFKIKDGYRAKTGMVANGIITTDKDGDYEAEIESFLALINTNGDVDNIKAISINGAFSIQITFTYICK